MTQAQNSLTQDQLSIEAKRYVNPATILQDQAAVTQAQATVTQDQKTLSETTLTAPFAGTVTVLNGAVGQTVSGGGPSRRLAVPSSASGSSGSGSGSPAAPALPPDRVPRRRGRPGRRVHGFDGFVRQLLERRS